MHTAGRSVALLLLLAAACCHKSAEPGEQEYIVENDSVKIESMCLASSPIEGGDASKADNDFVEL